MRIKDAGMQCFKLMISLGFVAVVAGCGGGVSSKKSDFQLENFDVGQAELTRLGERLSSTDPTPLSGIPSGGAEYKGLVIVGLAAVEDGAIGKSTILVDFTRNQVVGKIEDFVDTSGAQTAGTLDLRLAPIGRGQVTGFSATVDGTVGFATGIRTVNVDVIGGFNGANADVVSFGGEGTAALANAELTPATIFGIAEIQ